MEEQPSFSQTIAFGLGFSHFYDMAGVSPYFKRHCHELISKLSQEDVNNFKNIDDDYLRVEYLYEHAKATPILISPRGKSYATAVQKKAEGNDFFLNKDYDKAIAAYNTGIIECPHDTDEGKELLSVLFANRSATLFEQKKYEKVCEDIKYVLCVGAYPLNLMHKIFIRRAKCHSILKNFTEAKQAYTTAKSLIDDTVPNHGKKIQDINKSIVELDRKINAPAAPSTSSAEEPKNEELEFTPNRKYPSANKFVGFDEDIYQGRFAKAIDNIPAGAVIVKETPYVAVVSAENVTFNCTHCTKAIINPIPCETCAYAVFCSLACINLAHYHQYECSILPTMYDSGASINCIMALRMITKENFQFFWGLRNTLEDPEFVNDIYNHRDYKRVYYLCTNNFLRPRTEFIHYTFMAIFLLRLLKITQFFPQACDDQILTDGECYIGSLILRHIQILQFNAHEISELRNCPVFREGELNYKSCHVGGALYPTLALFNHSCEPSVIRYNVGSSIVTRAVKPIKKGEIIYENYGPIYCAAKKEIRQEKLRERYWFTCRCLPCEDEWDLFENLSEDSLRLVCPACSTINVLSKSTSSPVYQCAQCKKLNSLLPVLVELMTLDRITKDAEEAFMAGNFTKANDLYCEALPTYYKYLAPPLTDLVKIQQRLRTTMIHQGNTEDGYNPPNRIL